jgi:hypothetical protein
MSFGVLLIWWLLFAVALPVTLLWYPTLDATLAQAPSPDQFEPDDAPWEWQPIAAGDTQSRSLHTTNDNETLGFYLPTRSRLRIRLAQFSNTPDGALSLSLNYFLNASGTTTEVGNAFATLSDAPIQLDLGCAEEPARAGYYRLDVVPLQLAAPVESYTLSLEAVPCPPLTPRHVAFDVAADGTPPGPATLTIGSADDPPLDWEISHEVQWLTVGQTSGTTPASVPLAAVTSGLQPGVYTGELTVTFASSAGEFSQVVPVQLVVPGASVSGTITDQNGDPVPGVTVSVGAVDGLEVTQAIQTPQHTVPLVAGRPTVARVYARSGNTRPFAVGVHLFARSDGENLPGSPLAVPPVLLDRSRASRLDYSSTINVDLPESWMVPGDFSLSAVPTGPGTDVTGSDGRYSLALPPGAFTLFVHERSAAPAFRTVDVADDVSGVDFTLSAGAAVAQTLTNTVYLPAIVQPSLPDPDPIVEAPDPVVEPAGPNNLTNGPRIATEVLSVPPLRVQLVPVDVVQSGTTVPAPDDYSRVAPFLQKVFPVPSVDVGVRAPIQVVDTGSSQGLNLDVLDAVAATRIADDAPSWLLYHGVTDAGCFPINPPPQGAGVGFTDSRSSMSQCGPDVGTVGHEIGHNLGQLHSPCGVNFYMDDDFPYPDAELQQVGLDLVEDEVITSGGMPDHRDIMSYCEPEWPSDYTYRAWLENQRASGAPLASAASTAATVPEDVLLVRATIQPDGSADLRSIYRLTSTPAGLTDTSPYRVELRDDAGELLAVHPLDPHEIDHDAERRMIIAAVPRPVGGAAELRLLHDDTVLAAQPLGAAELAAATVRTTSTSDGLLRLTWDDPRPALVRYRPTPEAAWQTVALDARGGTLVLDPARLPAQGQGTFTIVAAEE